VISHRPDLDLAALRMLTLVADLGSISAAARVEQISQPSASKRIQVLERQLGLELLERRTRGAVLTEHGRLVTDWCRTVVAATDTLVTGSSALSEAAEEQLGIAASQTVAEYLCPRWLSGFRSSTHPPVRLHVSNSQGVIAMVRSRAVHLGFVETPSIPADLHRHPLASRRRPVTRTELTGMPLASREDGSGTRETLRHALGAQVAGPAIELDSNAAVKVLVSSGNYAAVISEMAVASEVRDGRLVEIPVTEVDLTRSLQAVWRRGPRLRGPAHDFLTMVLQQSGRDAPRDQESGTAW
jgi:molybdate transport repressor ModE-like protein